MAAYPSDTNQSREQLIHEIAELRSRLAAKELEYRELAEGHLRPTIDDLQTQDAGDSLGGDSGKLELEAIIDVPALQALMDDYYAANKIAMSVIDLKGKVLVGVGWQKVCTDFHRMHPEALKHCLESDLYLSAGLKKGEFRLYKCKNNMWDMATPIFAGEHHLGNIFTGQFFFENETIDYELFRSQAKTYGFDEREYLAALERVPRLDKEVVDKSISFFVKLAQTISNMGYSNVKLARLVAEKDRLVDSLEQSREILKLSQQIAHLGSWEYDLVNGRLTWSNEVYRIFGLQPQEFGATYEAFLERVHPDDRSAVDAAYRNSIRENRDSYEIEHRVIRPTGEIRYVHERCQHFRNAGGDILRSVGMVQDITDHKRSEKALQESEEKYRLTFDASPDAVNINRLADGLYVDINEGFTRLTGFTRQDCIGRSSMEINIWHDPADRDELVRGLRANGFYENLEARFRRKDGSITTALMSARVISLNNTPHIISITRDIGDRKRAEAERERLLSAIEQVGEVVFITDAAGVIEYVNPAFERITGYTKAEAIGQTPRILKSGQQDEQFYRNLWESISNGITFQGRMVNKRKDGTLYTEEATISPVSDATGKIVNYVAVKRDISAQLVLEEQFRQAQKMESVGRLAGGVAHDFNNMLSVILGNTEQAMDNLAPEDPLFDMLREILNASNRSADITRQLLAFARKQTIAPKVLDLNDTVEGMLKMLRRLIGEDIDLVWTPASKVWPIRMDPSQIDQILANLCVNARDAIEDGGKLVIETGVTTFAESYCDRHAGFVPGDFVLLAVSDNGCGMSPDILSNLFDPFFTTKGVDKGTGLGLATVYGIVKQNSGFINVYSEPGQGTTFKIYLPRYEGNEEKVKEDPATTDLRGNENILLVEDEPGILKMTRMMLERLGYTVLAASKPGEAIDLVHKHGGEIHLLITDVVMPEMNGRELAKNLVLNFPNLKCLFMSGYTANVIAHHGILDKGVHFIQKPFARKALAIKVRECLDNFDNV